MLHRTIASHANRLRTILAQGSGDGAVRRSGSEI